MKGEIRNIFGIILVSLCRERRGWLRILPVLYLPHARAQTTTAFDPFSTGFTVFSPTIAPSSTPSVGPTESTRPSEIPSSQPSISLEPSGSPSLQPSISTEPSNLPSLSPSRHPSNEPSLSLSPSFEPSQTPSLSLEPSGEPSAVPSVDPSLAPTLSRPPSNEPSQEPSLSLLPSFEPSLSSQPSRDTPRPSNAPTLSIRPSSAPTNMPSVTPSLIPSASPSLEPTGEPSIDPSAEPSFLPSSGPSSLPSESAAPTTATRGPTTEPSLNPSMLIVADPTLSPSEEPSLQPSEDLSTQPSSTPSSKPSRANSNPTATPSVSPSATESSFPSNQPSISSSESPSYRPSSITQAPTTSQSPSTSPSTSTSPSESLEPSQAPTGLNCYTNTTEIFLDLTVASMDDLKEYILCPNTVFQIGTVTGDNGMHPLLTRSNTVFKCGADGRVEDNCVLLGGEIHVGSSPEFFGEPAFNVFFEGITFRDAENIGLALRNEGNIVFINCIIENMQNTAPVFIDYQPTRRRLARDLGQAGSGGERSLQETAKTYLPFGQFTSTLNAFELLDTEQDEDGEVAGSNLDTASNIFEKKESGHSTEMNFGQDSSTSNTINSMDDGDQQLLFTDAADVQNGPLQRVTFHSTVFRDNTQRDGSAVIISGSQYNGLTIMASTFDKNVYDQDGAAILSRDASVLVSKTLFVNNQFDGDGIVVITGQGSYHGTRNAIVGTSGSLICRGVAILDANGDSQCVDINVNDLDPKGTKSRRSSKNRATKQSKARNPDQDLRAKSSKSKFSIRRKRSNKSNKGARRDRLANKKSR